MVTFVNYQRLYGVVYCFNEMLNNFIMEIQYYISMVLLSILFIMFFANFRLIALKESGNETNRLFNLYCYM